MKQYVKVMLGRKSCMADMCHAEGFIGAGFLSKVDFSKNKDYTYVDSVTS